MNSGPYDRGELRPHDASDSARDEGAGVRKSGARPVSWLAVARSLKLQGPGDMSIRLDEYLNGEVVDGED